MLIINRLDFILEWNSMGRVCGSVICFEVDEDLSGCKEMWKLPVEDSAEINVWCYVWYFKWYKVGVVGIGVAWWSQWRLVHKFVFFVLISWEWSFRLDQNSQEKVLSYWSIDERDIIHYWLILRIYIFFFQIFKVECGINTLCL